MDDQNQDRTVFLSFTSLDREAARTVVAGLRAAGVDVWWDEGGIGWGDDWQSKIEQALSRSSKVGWNKRSGSTATPEGGSGATRFDPPYKMCRLFLAPSLDQTMGRIDDEPEPGDRGDEGHRLGMGVADDQAQASEALDRRGPPGRNRAFAPVRGTPVHRSSAKNGSKRIPSAPLAVARFRWAVQPDPHDGAKAAAAASNVFLGTWVLSSSNLRTLGR